MGQNMRCTRIPAAQGAQKGQRPYGSKQSDWGMGRASASVGSLGSVQTSVPDVWYFVEKMGWSQSSSRWAHGATAARGSSA